MKRIIAALTFVFIATTLSNAGVVEKKSFKRTYDGLVVVGDLLASMNGQKIDNMRLYAAKSDKLEPIPYQIDEMTPDRNTYILPKGPKPNTSSGNGLLDKHDELVFMAKDVGSKVDAASYPSGQTKAAEILITDPNGGGKGWVYLFSFDTPPAPSKTDYVKWDNKKEEVVTAKYINGYKPGGDDIHFNKLVTVGAPKQVDFVDRLKIRLMGQLKMPPVKINFTEEDAGAKILRYKDGPVRIIREGKVFVKLPAGIKLPAGQTLSIYYESYGQGNVMIESKIDMTKFFKSFIFNVGTDLSPEAKGMKFYSRKNKTPFTIDGKMDENEKNADVTYNDWYLVTGTQGSLLNRSMTNTPLPPAADKVMVYVDDSSKPNPPEDHPGEIGFFASWTDMVKYPTNKDVNFMALLFYTPKPNYNPAGKAEFFDIEDKPPSITVGDKKGKSRALPWHPRQPKNYFLKP